MRNFDYKDAPLKLLSPEVVKLISAIHEHRGKQELYLEAHKDELSSFNSLLKSGWIRKIGSGQNTTYVKTEDVT